MWSETKLDSEILEAYKPTVAETTEYSIDDHPHLVKGKMRLSKDIKDTRDITRHGVQFKKERQETDLDLLYKLLKEKKVLRLAVISGVFGVGRSTALEWARILEAGDLATIRYPTVGDPKILLNEGEKSEDDEY